MGGGRGIPRLCHQQAVSTATALTTTTLAITSTSVATAAFGSASMLQLSKRGKYPMARLADPAQLVW